MLQFFRGDPMRSFILLSAVVHLLLLIGWPAPRRPFIQDAGHLAIVLLEPEEQEHKPSAQKTIPHKKATISKKKIPPPTKKTVTKEAIAKAKPHPAPDPNALARIKERLAQAQRAEELKAIREKLIQRQTGSTTPSVLGQQQYYADQLRARITSHWHLPEHLAREKLSATVSLTISDTGTLIASTTQQLSGNQLFDDSILRAINQAAPFPPFPAALEQRQEEFIITFEPSDLYN
ncbi:MAG: cell envelope integrity protein TolA [Deltaproteobacteria bacterium]|nr:cell envelope integrity protein TolA [Candidatus Anaeroferrophillus wilburensis]MBN2888093.1 cell envelope integrity protein TolA [Deltaproteobacteria bacterium]